jgi:hypothetical protein
MRMLLGVEVMPLRSSSPLLRSEHSSIGKHIIRLPNYARNLIDMMMA